MTLREEQEVTVTWIRSENVVRIYSSNPVEVRRLRKDDRVTQVQGDETWGNFTVPATDFSPLKGFKRRVKMSDAQKDVLRKRLKAMREDA